VRPAGPPPKPFATPAGGLPCAPRWEKQGSRHFRGLSALPSEADKLFEGTKAAGSFAEARIIVHGDQRSRSGPAPDVGVERHLSAPELVVARSTLSAVEEPGGAASHECGRAALHQLVGAWARGALNAERSESAATDSAPSCPAPEMA
jgi:hypothetical protein